MSRPYAFGIRTRHERFRLDERVSLPQLLTALKAAGLCISNNAAGEIVIHRMPLGATHRAAPPYISTVPGPETAA